MEAARLGLHDFPLSALGGGPRGPPGALGLSPEPWAAAAAALQSPASLASLSHALPGFLSHPQVRFFFIPSEARQSGGVEA